MPHLVGLLDDGGYDCDIYLDEIMRFYSCSLEQDNKIQAL